jgi:hypothetical protein
MQIRQYHQPSAKHYTQAVCARGAVDPAHGRPVSRSIRPMMAWARAEADRLRVPTAIETEVASNDAQRTALVAKRARIVDMAADGIIDKADRDRRLADVDEALAAIAVRNQIVAVPAIDWDGRPEDINAVLRAIWSEVRMGPDLNPVEAVWRVPEWRAD